MEHLVECIPNFSEGRRPEVVRALVAAVRAVSGVFLIDEEMDHDHHRAVLTFVGAPDAVAEAAFQAARTATGLIDLREHHGGGHPRVGATDVVPFVPIRGVTMDECVRLARRVGARIGGELGIPVFLYERAATHPERTNLEAIRRGGLHGLADRLKAEAAWAPDFGPPRLHATAGATVVGARPPLIAYNVNLQSTDLSAATSIAKAVRFSSGGLQCVKAIGVELSSRRIVQVSMNLTNFEETPVHVAFQAVKQEAKQRGISVVGSEIIGLIPQRALMQASEYFLQLDHFDPTQVLETRLDMALAKRSHDADVGRGSAVAHSVTAFLDAVSSGTPTPGGGSVAALAGALAAALGVMACRIGPRTDPESSMHAALHTTEQRLTDLRVKLERLVDSDSEAYAGVMQAYRLPKSDPQRLDRIQKHLRTATEVPLETATLANEVATLLRAILPMAKPSVNSDLKVGLLMASAAIEGGIENVRTNINSLKDQDLTGALLASVRTLELSLVELKRL